MKKRIKFTLVDGEEWHEDGRTHDWYGMAGQVLREVAGAELCHETLSEWFTIPKRVKHMEIIISDKPMRGAYECRLFKPHPTARIFRHEMLNPRTNKWEQVTLLCVTDRRILELLNIGKRLTATFWVELEY